MNAAGKLSPELSRVYFSPTRPVFELYDLVNDPPEFNNLIGKPEAAAIEQQLKAQGYVTGTSDNGPVVDDGYQDQAVEKLDGHKPAGPLRGGKYSAFDGGTRVPMLVRWPGRVQPGVSAAMVSQIDLLASFAALTGQNLAAEDAPDSFNLLPALLGQSSSGRDYLVEHAGPLSLIKGSWKYIEPSKGPKINKNNNTEMGTDPGGQLYNLADDLGERNNVAAAHPDIVRELSAQLQAIREAKRTRP